MDSATREQYEQRIAELATFCFHKLASLEARFVALCFRAEAAGIECDDLKGVRAVRVEEEAASTPLN